MIISAIKTGLKFNKKDVLFDLGCGNGALSELLFQEIKSYIGIDFSEYLINIAKKNFEKPGFNFIFSEANEFLHETEVNESVTKGLCYGVFSYFEHASARNILKQLKIKFPALDRFYIGNLPDKDRASKFYYKHIDYSKLLDDNQSSIGIWRNKDELRELFFSEGWEVEFFNMPDSFYSAHYRIDAILNRKP